MRQKFEVEVEGADTFEVVADDRDIRRWEAENDESFYESTTSATKFAQLAWCAAVRTGAYAGTWDEFNAVAVSVTGRRADPTTDPAGSTPKGRTGGSSSSSRSASGSSRASSKPKAKKS